jgi:transcriptional regulator with PAS, ATPase and Fis domain
MSQARSAAAAPAGRPVLLVGETGTGKELVAHAIHAGGPRVRGPFVAVHCGALSRDLIESDLFGHSPGAFTGALRDGRTGRFEAAHGGTIFLDEIDSLPMDLQVKFLRVLEEGEVVKLGSSIPLFVDVRLIAATSSDLRRLVEENLFRLDLLHRLCVHEIVLPPLRERREDVPLLVEAFLERESALVGRAAPRPTAETIRALQEYSWPGNVRELRNLCSLWAQTREGQILPEHLPAAIREPSKAPASKPTLRQSEEAVIRRALAECGGNVKEAAAKLGVAKTTVYRHLKKWAGV